MEEAVGTTIWLDLIRVLLLSNHHHALGYLRMEYVALLRYQAWEIYGLPAAGVKVFLLPGMRCENEAQRGEEWWLCARNQCQKSLRFIVVRWGWLMIRGSCQLAASVVASLVIAKVCPKHN